MIYTGYFARDKEYRERGYTTISISQFPPKYYQGLEWKTVAPSAWLLQKFKNHEIDHIEYEAIYISELESKKDKILAELRNYAEGDFVLLCYEKPGSFCHRHLFARWISELLQLDEPIIEFKINKV